MKIKLPRAEFFDVFGVGVFAVITFMSVRTFMTDAPIPYWFVVFLITIGVFGIIIDGVIVFRTYIKKPKTTGTRNPSVVK